MADKPNLKYHIKTVYNPKTGGTLLRPIITDRSSMNLDQVVKYALNASYVRGQYNDMRGVLNGFIEAIQQLGKDGFDVSLKNWLRVHGELKGSVGEDRQISSDNTYKVCITALNDLKRDVSEFSWTNVDTPEVVVKVENVFSVGSDPGLVVKSKDIMATGKNLMYSSTLGDAITVTWDGLAAPLALTPSESDYAHIKIAWPAAMAELEDDTVLTFTFKLHGGVEGSVEQTCTKLAVFKTA